MASGLLNYAIIAHEIVHGRPDFADRLVRPLAFRYGLVFLAVASLLLADQAIIQPLLVRLNGYAPIINLAGRQRMLSQKLAKQSLAIEVGAGASSVEASRRELANTVKQWSAAHHILHVGDPRQPIGPITTPRIQRTLRDIEPHFAAMQSAARQLASAGASQNDMAQNDMGLMRKILDHEADYLAGMERVVALLESEARERVSWLRLGALASAVIALVLLASLYGFVVRPATTLIRQQLRMLAASDLRHRALAQLLTCARDELEQRVVKRTKDLNHANAALEREMARRREVEMRMRGLSSELAHASRITALGQLATGLAHELNQPLGAIANYTGACELLLDDVPTDDRRLREAIGEVKRAALRAGEIVRRMRNFVRRSADQSSLVDLKNLVREVADLCEPELRRCGVELTLSLNRAAIPVVADPIQVQQVLVNLVQNAIQAMGDRDGGKLLGIRASITSSGAQIDVTDSGPGFLDGDDPFAPFFSTKADGLGMGLAISQTIIEQHQGRIWAGSLPAGGAIVSFCLPLAATPIREPALWCRRP
ncbi:MAG: ATP-binding protein, partial [Pirellulales bacterium]